MKTIWYDWGGLNTWLFQAINSQHSPAIDSLMLFATRVADHDNFSVYAALFSVMALLSVRYADRRALLTWLTVLSVFALGYAVDGWLVTWLKGSFSFPRPPLALGASMVHVVGEPELHLTRSFPSGHTAFASLLVSSLWPVMTRPARWLGVAFVVLVAVSRISLGAHFPADVLAGALTSLLVVVSLRYVANRMLVR